MRVTSEFRREVLNVWGTPIKVADAALNELSRHERERGPLDHKDHINDARHVGVLAGSLSGGDQYINFIRRFESEVLNAE